MSASMHTSSGPGDPGVAFLMDVARGMRERVGIGHVIL
jgi:hypothetical protein